MMGDGHIGEPACRDTCSSTCDHDVLSLRRVHGISMALASVVYPISLFWLILHAIHRFWITRTPQSILPSHGRAPSRGLGLPVKITLRHVYLRIDTNALNDDHDRLAVAFAKRRRALWTRAVIAFYDLGSIAGALGLFIALYLVLSTVLWSLRLSWNVPAASKPVYTTFSKRQFTEQDVGMAGSASRDAPVQLIVCTYYTSLLRV